MAARPARQVRRTPLTRTVSVAVATIARPVATAASPTQPAGTRAVAVADVDPLTVDVAQPDTEAVLAEPAAELGLVVERASS
jgi:hypothetical protein